MRSLFATLLALFAALPLAADEVPPVTAAPIEGPAAVTVGAEAVLELPASWRWIPAPQLKAYFAGSGRVAGAWDRGVAIDAEGRELRLLFEPCGPVEIQGGLDTGALFEKAQALAALAPVASAHARELTRWQQDPHWDPDAAFLALGAVWRSGEDESASLHLRWLGRLGVLKLDWRGPLDQADAARASLETLQQNLHWAPGQAHPIVATTAPWSKLGLEALALDSLVGRGALNPAPEEKSAPLWQWIAGALAVLVALGVGLYKATMGLMLWLDARAKARAAEARLDKLEKEYGGRAADVEEIQEDQASS